MSSEWAVTKEEAGCKVKGGKEQQCGFRKSRKGAYRRSRLAYKLKQLTEEQAFDMIRRVDIFFNIYMNAVREMAGYIGSMNFDSWIFDEHHYPFQFSWVHVDGTIGCNVITQTYPNIDEFVLERFIKMMAFPYLNFLECIVCGIWVHDKVLEIMQPKRAVKKYVEYAKLYEDKNRDMYLPDYYNDNGIVQADAGYLKKCIEAYGLNADEELGKVIRRFHIKKMDIFGNAIST